MSWSAYEVFSVLSGAVFLVAGLTGVGTDDSKERVWAVLGGVFFIGYGIFVAAQDSGTYTFPIVIFLVPIVAAGWLVYRAIDGMPRGEGDGGCVPETSVVPTSHDEDDDLHVILKDPLSTRCAHCGASLRGDARFCGSCGTAVGV